MKISLHALVCFCLIFFALSTAKLSAQNIFLVDSSKAGNTTAVGVSSVNAAAWNNACGDLQTAINTASAGDQIWVVSGTYKPSRDPFGNANPTNNRDKTFYLKSGVKIYGGFIGNETLLNQRNIKTNKSTLSGDIGNIGQNNDNCYHVVLSVSDAATTVLDGFTITGGNANGGGSMTVESKSIAQAFGGGIINESGALQIANCIITQNAGTYGGGVGLSAAIAGSTITNTVINNNSSYDGGGIICSGSFLTFTNCVLSGNTATHDGGGIHIYEGLPVFINVTVAGNTAPNGGGMNINSTNASITNSIVWGNSGITAGLNITNATPNISYSTIQAGMGASGSDPLFLNASDPDGADNIWCTGDDGLRLQSNSPARDAANPVTTSPVTDIAGYTRMGIFDRGAYESSIRYVKPIAEGNADGSSWANASNDIQLMIDQLTLGGEIWVAAGTYKPIRKATATGTITPNDRDNAFLLKEGIKLYGGFAGSETKLIDRNWVTNTTILSGNIGTANNSYDNCHHVVIMIGVTDATIMDGFTITQGYAMGSSTSGIQIGDVQVSRAKGGGMAIYMSNATLANLVITSNYALNEGGGIYAVFSSFTLSNSTISYNTVNDGGEGGGQGGGGLANFRSFPILSNVTISNNEALGAGGGGMYNNLASPILYNATIYGNTTNYRGGGVYNYNKSSPEFIGGNISNNIAGYGGGIANFYDRSSPVLTNTTISGNKAYASGGGMWNYTNVFPIITHCMISGNNAFLGGGIYNETIGGVSGSPTAVIKNTLICGNTAEYGGAMYNLAVFSLLITNSTISGNSADGALYNGGNGNSTDFPINNTIIYGNSSGIANGAFLKFNNCLVQGQSSTANGNMNGSTNPLFVNAPNHSSAPFTNGDYRLKSCSPVINTGNNSYVGVNDTLDKAGNPRIYNGVRVDMGAYEYQGVPANYATDYKTACESYTWIDGITYTSNNNTATHVLINSEGCDSLVTLHLTLLNNTSTDSLIACNSYTWIDGITYTSSNNTATYTLTNSQGCDSTIMLNLTIEFSAWTDFHLACNSFTWIDGITYTSSNNTATHHLTNSAGCGDIVITLNLEIITAPSTLYVKAGATGTGISWADASGDLQQVINNACPGSEIWVAAGTYKPNRRADAPETITPHDRNNAFVLKNNISLFGGFAGNETTIQQRNLKENITILSGDLGIEGVRSDNAFHVLVGTQISNTVIVDGFSIMHGNANGTGSITVNGQVMGRNNGGGMSLFSSSPSFLNMNFRGNEAFGEGGGAYITISPETKFINSVVSGNKAFVGGGLYIYHSSQVFLTNVTISGNTSFGINIVATDLQVKNCIIFGNELGGINEGNAHFYSIIQGRLSADNGNLGENNPLFSDAPSYTSAPTTLGDFHLEDCSPAINNGNNSYITAITRDIESYDRQFGASVDMGAYEYRGTIIPPASPIVSSQNIYMPPGSTVADLEATGSNLKWYTFPAGGVPLQDSTALQTRNYFVSQTIDGDICESPRVFIQVTVGYRIRYVKPVVSGIGDGSSWTNASNNLQEMIDAPYVQEVWVAAGTYRPNRRADATGTITLNDRDNAFVLRRRVKVYGGFDGTETTLLQRNHHENISILSGNLGDTLDSGDNTYHVVVCAGNLDATVLDGFTIKDGNADGNGEISVNGEPFNRKNGGGISVFNASSPVLSNLTVIGNKVLGSGGGISVFFSSPTITNCIVSGNEAVPDGGGIYITYSPVNITNTVVSGNKSGPGSGIFTFYSSPLNLVNVTISGNTNYGMVNFNTDPQVKNSIIYGNGSGGMSGGNPGYFNSLVQGLSSTANGNMNGSTNPLFINAPSHTAAPFSTGDYHLHDCSPVINKGNNSYVSGIAQDLEGNQRIFNNEIVDLGAYEYQRIPSNKGTDFKTACGSYTWIDGITYTSNNNTATYTLPNSLGCDSLVTLHLTLLNNKSKDSIMACGSYTWINGITYTSNNNTATYTLTNSLGCDSLVTLNLIIVPTHSIDVITAYGSYIWIDSITYTFSNNTATYTLTNSLGCDSVVTLNLTLISSATKYVKEGATSNGSSWANASGDIQNMINQTSSGGEIWVASGTYRPNRKADATGIITPNNRDNAFVLKKGVKVYGGFVGTETTLSQRNHHENTSILSGNIGDSLSQLDNTYHVVVCAGNLDSTVLDGFTIKDGNADGNGEISVNGEPFNRKNGGGISVFNASSPVLSNLTVIGNKVLGSGGGISVFFSSPTITNCIVSGNEAVPDGGGIYITYSPVNITNTVVSGNKSGPGAGIFTFYSTPLNLVNVTISGNTNYGMVNFNTDPQVKNSIIYGNGSGGMSGGNPGYFNSLVQGLSSNANGNMNGSINPLFINAPSHTAAPFSTGDYHLHDCSPVINKGNNSYVSGITQDLEGNQRIFNSDIVDLGAYEYQRIPSNKGTDFKTACGSYTWIDGITYTSNNNTATYTLPNSLGCDSLVTLHLTLLNNKSTDSIIACGSYTWINGITYTSNNNTATYTLTNSLGCDSLVTLNLIVVPTHSIDVITAYGSYTWIDGITYTFSNNTATYTLTNSLGCDSVVTLNLTLISSATKYVKEGATGNGSSWANASGDIQNMINQTSSGGEIWVASGTYRPNRKADATGIITPNNRDNAFVLKKGVKVYGGFEGTETTLSQRNHHENTSILSGNLGDSLSQLDNSYHVVVCAGNLDSTVLDGFTIKDGNADGNGEISVNGEPFNRKNGGGISVFNASSPVLSNLTVIDNKVLGSGGGISVFFSSPTITNCIVSGNEAVPDGGGIYITYSPVNITNTVVSGNKSGPGAGIFTFYSTPLNLVNVTISGNTNYGMVNFNTDPQVKNSIIYGNGSGGMSGGNPGYFNSLVQGLSSTANGNMNGSTNPLFINAPSHTAAPFSTGDYNLNDCSPLINKGNNSYVSGIAQDLEGNQRIFHNEIVDLGAYEYQGTSPIGAPIATSPQFFYQQVTIVDLSATGLNLKWYDAPAGGTELSPMTVLEEGTYYVSQANNGNPCESPRTSVEVEYFLPIRYVKPVATGNGSGHSWANASSDLQKTMEKIGVREVWVAAGTYKPNRMADATGIITPNNRDNAFVLKNGVKVYGGFEGTETTLSQRNHHEHISILSGNIGDSLSQLDNSYHVVVCAGNLDSTVLDGFTIKDGNADGNGEISVNGEPFNRKNGGGISVFNASSPQLSNLTVIGNKVLGSGGGISVFFSSPIITNCIVSGNEAVPDGGGIYITFSPVNITNTVISGNKSGPGAGIFAFYSTPLNLINVTINGNTNYGMVNFNTDPQVKNSIIYGNGSGGMSGGNPAYFNSLVQGLNNSTNGNISGNINPLFKNAPSHLSAPFTNGDYRLSPCSPAINAGSNIYLGANDTTDVAGKARRHNHSLVDMGAYETSPYQLQEIASTTLESTLSCNKNDGWIHYYNDQQEKILLSIHPHGQDLGTVNVSSVLTDNYDLLAAPMQAPFGQSKTIIPFNRSWSVNAENEFEQPVSVRFYFSAEDSSDIARTRGFQHLSELQVYKVNGMDAWDENASGYVSYSYDAIPDTAHFSLGTYDGIQYAEFQVLSFSSGTMAMVVDDAVLPLDLLSFTAAALEDKTYLQWHTVNEENVSHFEIERSSDARNWQTISSVSAINGLEQHYNVLDESPNKGNNYYRLKMVDYDGTYKYSKIVEVTFGNSTLSPQYFIYPNPNNGVFIIQASNIQNELINIELFDGLGRKVFGDKIIQGLNEIQLNHLTSGMYYLYFNNSQEKTIHKIVIDFGE